MKKSVKLDSNEIIGLQRKYKIKIKMKNNYKFIV